MDVEKTNSQQVTLDLFVMKELKKKDKLVPVKTDLPESREPGGAKDMKNMEDTETQFESSNPWIYWSTTILPLSQNEDSVRSKTWWFEKFHIHQWSDLDRQIVDCEFIQSTLQWEPNILRNDKSTPNLVTTAIDEWMNIVEEMKDTDLFVKGSMPEPARLILEELEKKCELAKVTSWAERIQQIRKLDPDLLKRGRESLSSLSKELRIFPLSIYDLAYE